MARVIATWALARSSYYAARRRSNSPGPPASAARGAYPMQRWVQQIRQVLDESVFHSEGYRKVWARLRHRHVRVWKERVLMRENQLLSPNRTAVVRPGNPHEGTILVDSAFRVAFRSVRAATFPSSTVIATVPAVVGCASSRRESSATP